MEEMVTTAWAWSGKRVFLTGHTGFKGAWLSLMLKRLGAELHGYALPPARDGLFEKASVAGCFEASTYSDLDDHAALQNALTEAAPDVVLHLAAQPLVRASYDDPVGTYRTNMMGTVHLLDAVRKREKVSAVVCVTSDKCYENREWDWPYREGDAVGGHDPYSSSKGCCELITSAYRRSFFQNTGTYVATARAGNVIGGGDRAGDRLIPDLISAMASAQPCCIRNPGAIRPWQHVLDAVFGYVRLAERLLGADASRFAHGWNFGPGQDAEKTVGEVADLLCELWGSGASWFHQHDGAKHEATFLKLDSSAARRHLGWTPVWSFERSMAQTVRWYREDHSGSDMGAVSAEQISEYLADVEKRLDRG